MLESVEECAFQTWGQPSDCFYLCNRSPDIEGWQPPGSAPAPGISKGWETALPERGGGKRRVSLQLHLHPILVYVVQLINMQDRWSSLSLLPTNNLKLGLIFTFYSWFFSAQIENCFYKRSLLVPETLQPKIQGCSQMCMNIAEFNPQQRLSESHEHFAQGWYVSGQPEFITVM